MPLLEKDYLLGNLMEEFSNNIIFPTPAYGHSSVLDCAFLLGIHLHTFDEMMMFNRS